MPINRQIVNMDKLMKEMMIHRNQVIKVHHKEINNMKM